MFLGIRTVIYPAPDLDASKAWFTEVLGFGPYFDESFYVGFEVAGYELALNPAMDPGSGPLTLWGVANIDDALRHLLAKGAAVHEEVREVGGGIRVGSVLEPGGSVLGLIENPHFEVRPVESAGPGR
jgi:catechol 2,3-dioxygenase-like lactoylglutathione lyase family enzyme